MELDALELKIQSDAVSASDGLYKLTQALKSLKTATSETTSGVASLAKKIEKISAALAGISSVKVDELTSMAVALKPLQSITISPALGKNVAALASAVNSVDWTSKDKLVYLAEGLRPLSELSKANLNSFITQIGKLGSVVASLDNVDLDKFARQMKEVAAAIGPLAAEMNKVSTGFSSFPSKISRVVSANSKLASSNGRLSKTYKTLGTAISFGGFRIVSKLIASAITKSNEYVENLNLFNVAMGKYATDAKKYAESVSELMGLDPSEWMRNQGVFMTLATGFGVASERAAFMSKNLTQLGYDLSSFFNISVEDAMQKLQSGIAGEIEPLRRLGYDLSQAKLEATALSLGIDETVSSMTQAEKAQLRYYAILKQVTTAQGDLSRTLDAPANQLRILRAQVEQVSRAFGNIFIPVLNKVLPYAIALLKVIREVADTIAIIGGFTLPEFSMPEDDTGGLDDLKGSLENATEAAEELKGKLAAFDELNVLGESSSGLSDILSGGSQFDFELPGYDFVGDAASSKVDEILDKWRPKLEWIKDNLQTILTIAAAVGAAFALWKISSSVSSFFGALPMLARLAPFVGIVVALIAICEYAGTAGELFDGLKLVLEGLVEFVAGVFTGDWTRAIEGLSTVLDGLKLAGEAVIDGIETAFTDFLSWLDEHTDGQYSDAISRWTQEIENFAEAAKIALNGLCDFLKAGFAGDWESAWTVLKETAVGIFNELIDGLEIRLNAFIEKVNKTIRAANTAFGWNIPEIGKVSLPDVEIPTSSTVDALGSLAVDSAVKKGLASTLSNLTPLGGTALGSVGAAGGMVLDAIANHKQVTQPSSVGSTMHNTTSGRLAGGGGGSFASNTLSNADLLGETETQTGLLAEMNGLLGRIAEQDRTVTFAPSAEAGRVVQRSINLYNMATGR